MKNEVLQEGVCHRLPSQKTQAQPRFKWLDLIAAGGPERVLSDWRPTAPVDAVILFVKGSLV